MCVGGEGALGIHLGAKEVLAWKSFGTTALTLFPTGGDKSDPLYAFLKFLENGQRYDAGSP